MLTPAHIDLYLKMVADPVTHAGYRVDAALIYCEHVEIQLGKLEAGEREIVLLRSYGYTQAEIAKLNQVSLRTMSRECVDIDTRLFAEFRAVLEELDMTMRQRHGCADGKRIGRPPKKREATA